MDSKSSKVGNLLYYLTLVLICAIYLFVRLYFPETIEFGYDQPLLATQVIEFIKNPSFINSYDFVRSNPWGYPSWGPAQIFFWVPFLLTSKNPISISYLVAVFNLLGVIFIFFTGQKFFSKKVAIISSLFLALHPWSVIFSRMIYQPTPVITISAVIIFLTFYVLDNPKSKLLIVLLPLSAFAYQVYIHSITLVVLSLGFILQNIKKIFRPNLLIGFLFAVFMFLPVIYFWQKNPTEITGFSRVSYKFDELRSEAPYTFFNIAYEFLGVTAGGRLSWQLGYGYKDFLKEFPTLLIIEKIGLYGVVFLIFYHFVKIIRGKRFFDKRVFLLLSFLLPVLFLTLIKTPIALPRFFLIGLPAFSLLVGILVEDIAQKYKNNFPYVLVGLVLIFWIQLMFKYYDFVKNYSYKNGFLSNFSDVPFSFLDKSFKWVASDANRKGYGSYKIDSVNQASRYYIDHILDIKNTNINTKPMGYYKIVFSSESNIPDNNHVQFGPYLVFEVSN